MLCHCRAVSNPGRRCSAFEGTAAQTQQCGIGAGPAVPGGGTAVKAPAAEELLDRRCRQSVSASLAATWAAMRIVKCLLRGSVKAGMPE
jgi:hypothetical protein